MIASAELYRAGTVLFLFQWDGRLWKGCEMAVSTNSCVRKRDCGIFGGVSKWSEWHVFCLFAGCLLGFVFVAVFWWSGRYVSPFVALKQCAITEISLKLFWCGWTQILGERKTEVIFLLPSHFFDLIVFHSSMKGWIWVCMDKGCWQGKLS